MRKKVKVHKVSTLEGHKGSIYALTGDSLGSIFTSGGDGMVVKWDLSKPQDGELLANLESSVYSVTLTADESQLIVGHNHEGIHVIDIKEKKEAYNIGLTGCQAIYEVKVFKNTVFALSQSGFLYVIDLLTKKVTKKKVSERSLRTIVITPDKFLIGSSDNTIRVLNHSFEEINVLTEATKSVFSLVDFKKEIITSSRDAHIRVYNQELQMSQDIVAHMYAINHLTLSPSGEYFASASMDHTLKIWDASTRDLLKVIDKTRHNGHSNSVNRVFWSQYNNLLVSCSDDRTLGVWDLEIE